MIPKPRQQPQIRVGESPLVSRSPGLLSLGDFGRDILNVVVCFELGGWDVAEFAEQTLVVEPVDPFEGGELQIPEATLGTSVTNQFGLVRAVDCLGLCVAVAIAA
jgi:hypothetical protein